MHPGKDCVSATRGTSGAEEGAGKLPVPPPRACSREQAQSASRSGRLCAFLAHYLSSRLSASWQLEPQPDMNTDWKKRLSPHPPGPGLPESPPSSLGGEREPGMGRRGSREESVFEAGRCPAHRRSLSSGPGEALASGLVPAQDCSGKGPGRKKGRVKPKFQAAAFMLGLEGCSCPNTKHLEGCSQVPAASLPSSKALSRGPGRASGPPSACRPQGPREPEVGGAG